jgi:hypothetical protein
VDIRAVFFAALVRLTGDSGDTVELVFKPENFPTALGSSELLTQLAVEILRAGRERSDAEQFEIRANESDHFLETTVGPVGKIQGVARFTSATPDSPGVGGELAYTLCRDILSLHGGDLLTGPDGIVRFTLPRGR